MLTYEERDPGPELQPHVRCLWRLAGRAAPGAPPELIVPDGCMELVVHAGEPFAQLTPAGARQQPRVMVVGEVQRPVETRPTGEIDVVGARFWPGGAAAFLDVASVDELAGQVTDDSVVRRRAELASLRSATPDRRLGLLRAWLLRELGVARRRDPVARRAASLLVAAEGRVRIEALGEAVGVSRRHLERRFRETVGMTPKALAQVLRFRRVLRALETAVPRGSALAAAHGYADQSHLIRDFRRYTGRTPTAYLAASHPLTTLFAQAG